MTPKRFFYIMCGVNALLIVIILTSVYFGKSIIETQSEKLSKAKTQNQATQALQDQLTQAKKDVEKYAELNQIANTIIPKDKDQAKTVFEINKVADETGVPLKGIQFESSNLGQAPAPTAKSTTEEGAASTPKATTPSISQVKPVDGLKGVLGLPITVSSQENQPVQFDNLIAFLQKLEANRRTAHVTSLSIKPDEKSAGLSFNITLNAYVKP